MQEPEVANLPLSQVADAKFLLRPVDRTTAVFTELLDSIRQNGLANSILVRPHPDGTPGHYQTVDGMYRKTCCEELGHTHIPAIVREMMDEEVLAWQIRANGIRPETKKIDYARQIRRIQEYRPGVTLAAISQWINKAPTWVRQQLDLLELDDSVQQLVDDGEIPLQSAYMLAKVPRIHRTNELIAQACVLSAAKFKAVAAQIIKNFMEDVRNGRLSHNYNDKPFTPVAWYRGNHKVQAELQNPFFGPEIIVSEKLKKPLDIWRACLKWVLNLDAASVEAARRDYEKNRPKRNLMDLYESEPDEVNQDPDT